MYSESSVIETCMTQLAQMQSELTAERRRADRRHDQLLAFRVWLDANHFTEAATRLDEVINGHNSES